MRKLLVTSALPYANGSIHLGHLVEYIQTDIWVRYQKMSGNETYYICADDTHGTPIMLKAEEEKISPDELVKKVHQEHDLDFKEFNVNFEICLLGKYICFVHKFSSSRYKKFSWEKNN